MIDIQPQASNRRGRSRAFNAARPRLAAAPHRMATMSKRDLLPDRALELASKVGDNLQQMMPSAGTWLRTGIKLGALKSGARVATGFVRRHPALALATAAGTGLLWYAARRKAKRDEDEALEGSSTRVEARRANGSGARKKPTARKRTSASRSARANAE